MNPRGIDTSEGMAHLQTAAREMVAAARSFLDALEEVVDDDDRMTTMVSGVTDVLKDATHLVGGLGRRGGSGASASSEGNGSDAKVERIDLD